MMKKNKFQPKEMTWDKVKVSIMGKDITGIKSVIVKETGLSVDKEGLKRDFEIINAQTGKKI